MYCRVSYPSMRTKRKIGTYYWQYLHRNRIRRDFNVSAIHLEPGKYDCRFLFLFIPNCWMADSKNAIFKTFFLYYDYRLYWNSYSGVFLFLFDCPFTKTFDFLPVPLSDLHLPHFSHDSHSSVIPQSIQFG